MEDISDEAVQNRASLAEIKRMYHLGKITREQARKLASPVIKRINDKARNVAARHNKKYSPIISFISAMRTDYGSMPLPSRFVVDEADLIISKPKKQRDNNDNH